MIVKPFLRLKNICISAILIIAGTIDVFCQELPPIPVQVQVNTAQFLNFGSFAPGVSGGTVSVDYNGIRTTTGDITLFNFGPSPSSALFDLTANPGTIINIMTPSNVLLTGSNGGQISLSLDSYSTGQVFVTGISPPATTPVFVGGTLVIGNISANPPGNYQGVINLTFIQE